MDKKLASTNAIKNITKKTLSSFGLYKIVKYIFFYGNKFICPCCDGNFRKMQSYIASSNAKGMFVNGHAKNAICPNCGSHMRYRFMLSFLKNHTDIFQKKIKLLHFAPEKQISDFLKKQKNIDYFVGDIDPTRYGSIAKLDITNINFPDNNFDVVLCSHVLEHVQEDEKAISEIYRVTKTNGWAVIMVPIYDEAFENQSLDYNGREKMYGIGDHKRLNSAESFKLKLSDAGFNVRVYSLDDIPGQYVERMDTSSYTRSDRYLFFCKK